jgi:Sec-independent protein translocase protein TatA
MKKADHEQLMVQYLLGGVPEAEQLRLEERFFTDDEAYQQLLALEDELRYDYAQGALSGSQREQFEHRFLASPAERQRVELAQAIMNKVAEARPEAVQAPGPAPREAKSWRPSLLAFFGLQNSTLQFPLAAAGLILLLGAALLVFVTVRLQTQLDKLQAEWVNERQSAQRQIAAQRARQDQLSSDLEKERQQRARLAQELSRQQAQAGRGPARAQPPRSPFLAFVLSPGLLRDVNGPKRLLIPPGVGALRLQLDLKKRGDYPRYRVALKTLDDAELWSQDVARAHVPGVGRAVILSLPAKLLPEGDYVLTLLGATADGALAEIDDYHFSIVKR